jgi:hypothetical protein
MIGRLVVLAGGVAGAISLSQFPEFSQQYLQRLAGQVDALTIVVKDFDATATKTGLTRDQALGQLQGSAFLDGRRADMTRTFGRHDQLVNDLTILRATGPLERLLLPHRMGDLATLQSTWADFKPAVPVTTSGLVSAAVGFGLGYAVLRLLLGVLTWPFRRRQVV